MERMNQKELNHFIQRTSFIIQELVLYLDTHPDCPHALNKYKENQMMFEKAMSIYQKRYGAITMYGIYDDNEWTWGNEPWPWQKGCGC